MDRIFFDLDDTLIQTSNINKEIFKNIRRKLNIHVSDRFFMSNFRSILRKNMLKIGYFTENESIGIDPIDYYFFKGDYPYGDVSEFKENVYNEFKDTFKGEYNKELLDNEMYKARLSYTETIHGMKEVLSYIGNYKKISLITNGIYEVQLQKIKSAYLDIFFEDIFISGEYGFGKPDPKFYKLILEKSNVKPNKAIMIGDNVHADYFGSMANGMNAIFFGEKKLPYAVNRARNAEELLEKLKPLIF